MRWRSRDRAGGGRGRGVPPSEVATPPSRPGLLPPGRHVLLVAAGGAIGALARVALAELFPVDTRTLPWPTFLGNVTGAFALALVLTLLVERTTARPEARLAACTGALGAFTTYSALAVEASSRLTGGAALLGAVYGVASVAVGVLAAVAGARAARRRPSRRPLGERS